MMNITCDTIIDLVSLYKDGTASKSTMELVNDHLRECPECRYYYRHYRIRPETPEQKAPFVSELNPNEADLKYFGLSQMINRKRRNDHIATSFGSIALIVLTAAVCLTISKKINDRL
ncbi:hypothetical protein SDC9_77383 [bioreactor metagenome]|uniref:Putative zinc-finger domain-containing protein n=1 Tax=bioreactor metagenome TaxID=1076179 RepID=A0A644YWJ5_9ZZZZ|nr:zf-HC2 domain-containing protein [Oscillospiraceae bacterium]